MGFDLYNGGFGGISRVELFASGGLLEAVLFEYNFGYIYFACLKIIDLF